MSTETGKYIVVFKEGVSSDEIAKYIQEITTSGGKLGERYDPTILNGFSAAIPDAYLTTFKSLQADKIDYIEADGVVTTQS